MLHVITAQNVLSVRSHLKKAIAQKAVKAIIKSHQASQSSQSVIFTACEVDVIMKMKRGIYHKPISVSPTKGMYIDVYHNLK